MRASLVTSAKGFQGRSFLTLSGLAPPPPPPPGAAAGAGWITRTVQAVHTTRSETRSAGRMGRTPEGQRSAYSSGGATPQPGPGGCPKHKRPIILEVYL